MYLVHLWHGDNLKPLIACIAKINWTFLWLIYSFNMFMFVILLNNWLIYSSTDLPIVIFFSIVTSFTYP